MSSVPRNTGAFFFKNVSTSYKDTLSTLLYIIQTPDILTLMSSDTTDNLTRHFAYLCILFEPSFHTLVLCVCPCGFAMGFGAFQTSKRSYRLKFSNSEKFKQTIRILGMSCTFHGFSQSACNQDLKERLVIPPSIELLILHK